MKRSTSLFANAAVWLALLACISVSAKTLSPPYISWEERAIPNQYLKITINGDDYWSPNIYGGSNPNNIPRSIDPSEIGELIYQTIAFGYNHGLEPEPTINCSVYSILSISESFAVAVKYEGFEGYYVFINPSYAPETLGDMIADLNLQNESSVFGMNFPVRGSTRMIYIMPDNSAIWDLLISNTDSKGTKLETRSGDGQVVTARLLDDTLKQLYFLYINPNGSLQISHAISRSVMFFINASDVQAFMEYVETHGDGRVYQPPAYNPFPGMPILPTNLPAETESGSDNQILWIVLVIVGIIAVAIIAVRAKKAKGFRK